MGINDSMLEKKTLDFSNHSRDEKNSQDKKKQKENPKLKNSDELKDSTEKLNKNTKKQMLASNKSNDNFGGYVLYDDDEYMNSLGMDNAQKKSHKASNLSKMGKSANSKSHSRNKSRSDDFELPENWDDSNRQDRSEVIDSTLNNDSIKFAKLNVDKSLRQQSAKQKSTLKNSSRERNKQKSERSDFNSFNEIINDDVDYSKPQKREKSATKKIKVNNLIDRSNPKHKQSNYDSSDEEDRRPKRKSSKGKRMVDSDSDDEIETPIKNKFAKRKVYKTEDVEPLRKSKSKSKRKNESDIEEEYQKPRRSKSRSKVEEPDEQKKLRKSSKSKKKVESDVEEEAPRKKSKERKGKVAE